MDFAAWELMDDFVLVVHDIEQLAGLLPGIGAAAKKMQGKQNVNLCQGQNH